MKAGKKMKVLDLHCDALLRLQEHKGALSFENSVSLNVNYQKMKAGDVKVQAFAIFIEPDILVEDKYASALEQVRYFKEEVIGKNPKIKQIRKWEDLEKLAEDEIGAFLTLESVESIGNDIKKLEFLLDEGVLSVGITWNPANLACDGIGEPRGGGLTQFGYQIVEMLNERNILTDVSHISENGFWDVLRVAKYPIASHSNVRELCGHLRNLTKEQIIALLDADRMIHLVYNPPFTVNEGEATIADLLKHIDYIIQLGGAKNIGLGSDFDGISSFITDLEDSSKVQNLLFAIETAYGSEIAEDIAYRNFMNHLPK